MLAVSRQSHYIRLMNSVPLLRALLAVALLGAGGMGYWFQQTIQSQKKTLAAAMDEHHRQLDDLVAKHDAALTAEQERHSAELKRVGEEHEKAIDSIRKDQQRQMTSALKEFDSIFDGNRKTIDYINAMEAKVKSGQLVSKLELEKLAIIATGLSYLQKEYQKPFTEFKELEKYFSRQSASLPAKGAETPQRFGFFKRLVSKEYREAERQQLRDQGAREAFEAAQVKFTSAYASAQRQMAAVSVNAEGFTKKLYDLMAQKAEANKEDLGQFFEQARKALRTHQNVLDFQPPQQPEASPKP